MATEQELREAGMQMVDGWATLVLHLEGLDRRLTPDEVDMLTILHGDFRKTVDLIGEFFDVQIPTREARLRAVEEGGISPTTGESTFARL